MIKILLSIPAIIIFLWIVKKVNDKIDTAREDEERALIGVSLFCVIVLIFIIITIVAPI